MMRLPTLDDRAAGVLLHPTSLPEAFGNGDLGPAAHRFADFLGAAGQRWWQMLPVHPVGGGYSPYNGLSAFAGAPHLIALEPLADEGWLRPEDVAPPGTGHAGKAQYGTSLRFREARLRKAFARFEVAARTRERRQWEAFRESQAPWLEDYTLFAALKRAHGGVHWARWPEPLRTRRAAALREAREVLVDEIRFRTFLQFQFDRQWAALRERCKALGIALLGDLPIFVAHDSADVWSHRELFHIDRQGRLPVMAGVPPDDYSANGQRWGNPLYDWPRHKADGYAWWTARLRATMRRFDAVRLDHFIGFVRYWAIPAGQKTAKVGRFRPGPGAHFLAHLQREFGRLPLIAEDLGLVTPAVTTLREQFDLPGMRVLQFAFGADDPENPHLPHCHERNGVVYTGTHDNDTIMGWARHGRGISPDAKRALAYLGHGEPGHAAAHGKAEPPAIHWEMIRMALSSVANLAIVPAQDLLGLGNPARMNLPGTPRGNWDWRLQAGALTDEIAAHLRALTELYGRVP